MQFIECNGKCNMQYTSRKLLNPCDNCRKLFCGKCLFSRVDGNNISITKNAKNYCEDCYKQIHPNDY